MPHVLRSLVAADSTVHLLRVTEPHNVRPPPRGWARYQVVDERPIGGELLSQLLALYDALPEASDSMRCHVPAYAFRVETTEGVVTGTICFQCCNLFWYDERPGGERIPDVERFDGGSSESAALLRFCRARFPASEDGEPGR